MKVGKLPALPWYLRLVAFLAIGGVMYAGFWYFVTSGTRKATKEMEDEIAQLRPRNAQASIVQQNLNNFKAAYKAREEEYAELKALLPEQRELTADAGATFVELERAADATGQQILMYPSTARSTVGGFLSGGSGGTGSIRHGVMHRGSGFVRALDVVHARPDAGLTHVTARRETPEDAMDMERAMDSLRTSSVTERACLARCSAACPAEFPAPTMKTS